MRRRLPQVFGIASLILFLMNGLLWLQSQWFPCYLIIGSAEQSRTEGYFRSAYGAGYLSVRQRWSIDGHPPIEMGWIAQHPEQLVGERVQRWKPVRWMQGMLVVAYWFPAALLSIPLISWARQSRHHSGDTGFPIDAGTHP